MDDLQFRFGFDPVLEIMPRLGTMLDIVSVRALSHCVLLGGQASSAFAAGFSRIRLGIDGHGLKRILLVEFHFVSFRRNRM